MRHFVNFVLLLLLLLLTVMFLPSTEKKRWFRWSWDVCVCVHACAMVGKFLKRLLFFVQRFTRCPSTQRKICRSSFCSLPVSARSLHCSPFSPTSTRSRWAPWLVWSVPSFFALCFGCGSVNMLMPHRHTQLYLHRFTLQFACKQLILQSPYIAQFKICVNGSVSFLLETWIFNPLTIIYLCFLLFIHL